ncbi:MAG: hypothetical protein HQL50_01870 [Magnetococcales bacterium]|nr:hypothetical protein [Magnetococcales bacterium]
MNLSIQILRIVGATVSRLFPNQPSPMTSPTIFSIIPPRLGGLDVLLPIYLEIRRDHPDAKIHLLFIEPSVYSKLKRDPFLYQETLRVCDSISHLYSWGKPGIEVLRYLMALVCLIPSLIRLLATKAPILFYGSSPDSRTVRWMSAIARFRGGWVVQHPPALGLLRDSIMVDIVENKNASDLFACYSMNDLHLLEKYGLNHPVAAIGYPRLYPGWLDRIREVAPKMMEKEITRLGFDPKSQVVSLFLGSWVKGIYNLEELDTWIEITVPLVRKKYPNALILLKPHPMSKREHLEKILEQIGDNRAVLCYLHASIIATRSDLIVGLHSGVLLDAIASGTPTIQFQEFTPHWLRRHPDKSVYLRLKHPLAENLEDLSEAIDDCMAGHYRQPDYEKNLGHRADIAPLLRE